MGSAKSVKQESDTVAVASPPERPAARPAPRPSSAGTSPIETGGAKRIDPSDVNTLIHLVYEGLLESDPWSSFLYAVRMAVRSSSALLMFGLPSERSIERDIDDSEWQVKTLQKLYYARFRNLNPIRHDQMKQGVVYSMSEFISDEELEQTTYYKEFLKYADLYHALICRVGQANGVPVWLHVARSQNEGPYTASERRLLATLAPHIHRALRLGEAMTQAESQKNAYRDALDTLRLAIVLLDSSGAILNMNDKAEEFIANHPAFRPTPRTTGSRLELAEMRENQQFRTLLSQVLEDRGTDHAIMPAGEHSGAVVNLLVRRFAAESSDGNSANPNSASPISAVLYIKDPTEVSRANTDAISVLYGLRPTESRLVAALAAGASIKEAAVQLGMSELTVRTYVKRILQKTGMHRQTDLVQLINSSLAIMT